MCPWATMATTRFADSPLTWPPGSKINGMTIAGEQDVPLENKERVELLKGIAGVESGVASAAGLINYVTKRPATIEAIDLATDHRGTAYGAVDFGHLFGSKKQLGARINSGRRTDCKLHERYRRLARNWRGCGRLEAQPQCDSERRLRVPAQNGTRRKRLPIAGRHHAAGYPRNLPINDARRPALGTARHV